MNTFNADVTRGIDTQDDSFRWRPSDPEHLTEDLEFVAKYLDSAMLGANGEQFMKLYQAAKKIGEIAEHGFKIAQLD